MKNEHTVESGYLVREEKWGIPFDTRFIPYHISVVGATGSGKSFLARHLLLPLLQEAGYGVLVLDWVGMDYSPYFRDKTIISISKIALDPESVVRYLLEKCSNFGYSQEEHTVSRALEAVLSDEMIDLFRRQYSESPRGFINAVKALVTNEITRGKDVDKLRESDKLALSRLERWIERITEEDVKVVLGGEKIEDLMPEPGELRVMNMHGVEDSVKLTFFSTLARHLLSEMHKGKDLNLALIIDEAPQYCPFAPEGYQVRTTRLIKDLCALGRKHRLCVVLISQGMAGEIGINAAVRRNINTWFIGQIHPLDFEEASKRLTPYGINPERLLSLEPGIFYFTGKMNPSPTPLLISFKVEDEGDG